MKEKLIDEIKKYEADGNTLDEFMFAFVDDTEWDESIENSELKEVCINHIEELGSLHPEYELYTKIRAEMLIKLDLAEECINWVNGYDL